MYREFVIAALRRCVVFWLLWFVVNAVALAQSNFQPGYVVPTAADTVRGLIDYRSLAFNSMQCRFQAHSATSQQSDFLPSKILGYGLTGGPQYEAHTVLRPDSTSGTYFLEVAHRGNLGLLLLYDEASHLRYFLKKPDGQIVELVEYVTTISEGGRVYKRVRKPYLGELAVAFAACPAEQTGVQSIELNTKALVDALRRYNYCVTGQQIEPLIKAKNDQLIVVIGVSAWHKLILGNGNGTFEHDDSYDNGGIATTIGVQYRFGVFHSQRISAVCGVLYQSGFQYRITNRTYSLYTNFLGNNDRRISAEFKFNCVQLPLLMRYYFPFSFGKLYVEGGPMARIIIRTQRNELVYAYGSGPDERYVLFEGGARSINLGLIGGAGIDIGHGKRAPSVAVRYEVGSGGSPLATGSVQRVLNVQVAYPVF